MSDVQAWLADQSQPRPDLRWANLRGAKHDAETRWPSGPGWHVVPEASA